MFNLTMSERFFPESEIRGTPHRLDKKAQNFQGWSWVPVEWSQVVRDSDGEIIFTHTQCNAMLATLSEVLGKPLFSVFFVDEQRSYPDQAAFGLPPGMTLDAEELAAVGMAAWINATHFPGVKRNESATLPHDINEYANQADSTTGLDAQFYSVEDANQMASVLSILYNAKSKVVRDGERWGVVVNDERFLDSRRILELSGIHKLLAKYAIIPLGGSEGKTAPAFTKRITDQAAFETRIEDKLDAILAALVGTEGAKQIVGDSHRLPDVPPRMTGTGK